MPRKSGSRNFSREGGTSRVKRVNDLIQSELATILQRDTEDKRFNFVTITAVSISPDFSHARIYVSMLDDSNVKPVIQALNHASKFLRFKLAQKIDLRIIPDLHFHYDDSLQRGQRINTLIDEALKKDSNK